MTFRQNELASGKIAKAWTYLTLYRDGTFTATGMTPLNKPDRLVSFSVDMDSMRRKSVVGRGTAALLTGGMSLAASNNRGVLYVTIIGGRSGTKTYTTKNPENDLLSSVRSLQAAADTLMAASPATRADPPSTDRPALSEGTSHADGPYANHPVLSELPRRVRERIADQIAGGKLIGAIKTLRDNQDLGLREAKDVIDELRHLPTESGNANLAERDNNVAAQLKMLADLHTTGALSDEEFASAKARLLS